MSTQKKDPPPLWCGSFVKLLEFAIGEVVGFVIANPEVSLSTFDDEVVGFTKGFSAILLNNGEVKTDL